MANGAILDPSGGTFIARGINVFLGQADTATIVRTFPGINMVRLATTPGADPNAIDTLVQGLTASKIVVEIEDHSSSGGNPNTLSGTALASQANWYASLAAKYQKNPFVWFGTANEPDNTADPQAVVTQEQAIYRAIRGTGSTAMTLLEMRGGFTNDAALQSAATYAGMTNVAWDTHFYGWVVNYSTNASTIAAGLKAQIANAQTVRSADGVVPVVIGEYGPSTTGSGNYDANGLQVVQAVHDSGYGAIAWAFNAGTDALTSNGTSLTDFGRMVAQHIAAAPAAPPVSSPPPADPASTVAPATHTVTLRVSEDAWQGDARYTIAVDGTTIGGTRIATASHALGQSQTVALTGTWAAGPHRIDIAFLNDAYGGTPQTDRNLLIDAVQYDGQAVGGPVALYDARTASFTTPVSTALRIGLCEDAWNGDAQYGLTIDGAAVGTTKMVTASRAAGQMQFTALQLQLRPGVHDLGITFLNDAYGGTPQTDRNLFVSSVEVAGHAIAGGAAALFSAGTAHFAITVPSA